MDEQEREVRIFSIELREQGERPMIVAYPAVFNVRSHYLGFYEFIRPGAFTRTLATAPDVRANVQHGGALVTIGRTTNGTLQLSEDERGLRAVIVPPDTQAGRDTVTLVREGYVNEMSFAFRVPAGGDRWQIVDGEHHRELLEVDLDGGDVAVVTGPAYPQTTAEVRALVAGAGQGDVEGNQDAQAGAGHALALREIELMQMRNV